LTRTYSHRLDQAEPSTSLDLLRFLILSEAANLSGRSPAIKFQQSKEALPSAPDRRLFCGSAKATSILGLLAALELPNACLATVSLESFVLGGFSDPINESLGFLQLGCLR